MTLAAQKQLAVQALALPRKARQQLVQQLRESLELEEKPVPRKEWNAAWETELEKRMADIETGKVKCIPYAEVRKKLDRILRKA